ncbi:MAG: alpha-galactosidase [Verrucomicrobia bacterium]|nr:alpha-galactosidase [Verrucomicrobiota bacterium]MBU4291417.1 alpha-galactosidase [Verrucomicrobiota bacterium]MBU4429035.1 alpha-galactosidase [Verrucomicrobiota bacterium]MCG2680306.1 alpha-galactosidase [Kiritimatiellia bacterium]
MAKIAFIGAGSFGFTRTLTKDILTFPLLKDATLALMDINPQRLAYSKKAVERIVREGKYPARVVATTNRREALKGADAVICTILSGDVNVWQYDITIPKRFGVDTNVGDTRSVSGVFRALRTIPVMVDICRDMEAVCPDAILLNYTNPMAMLCRAMQKTSRIQVTGLCHSVQGTAQMLAKWIGAPMSEITYVCGGINHQAWYLKFEWKKRDAYPLIRRAIMDNPKIRNEEQVRNEMFLHLDRYVSESSGHNSEYNWWFRKRPDLIKKYCIKGTGWNPGEYAYILNGYRRMKHSWRKHIQNWLNDPQPLNLKRGHEYAASIINARLGGEIFEFNGNVPNTGLISNLPPDVCVEVPVFANQRGFNPVPVGALPPQCAALNNISVAVEEMAVEAALTGNPRLVFQAIAYDPLSAAVLSLAEIKRMVQEMLNKNKAYLPKFKHLKV